MINRFFLTLGESGQKFVICGIKIIARVHIMRYRIYITHLEPGSVMHTRTYVHACIALEMLSKTSPTCTVSLLG